MTTCSHPEGDTFDMKIDIPKRYKREVHVPGFPGTPHLVDGLVAR